MTISRSTAVLCFPSSPFGIILTAANSPVTLCLAILTLPMGCSLPKAQCRMTSSWSLTAGTLPYSFSQMPVTKERWVIWTIKSVLVSSCYLFLFPARFVDQLVIWFWGPWSFNFHYNKDIIDKRVIQVDKMYKLVGKKSPVVKIVMVVKRKESETQVARLV
jgi:hypothetical protein